MMRRFVLDRRNDISGVSGTGLVAHGVQFPHHVIIEWQVGGIHSVAVYNTVDELMAIVGHGGQTRIKWLDADCQDRCSEDLVGALYIRDPRCEERCAGIYCAGVADGTNHHRCLLHTAARLE